MSSFDKKITILVEWLDMCQLDCDQTNKFNFD